MRTNSTTVPCAACGAPLRRAAHRIRLYPRSFCNATCRGKGMQSALSIPCATCGAPVIRWPSQLRNGALSYCNAACQNLGPHERGRTHGRSRTKEYRTWSMMIQRCENPRLPDYPKWGGRGITICPEWRRSFEVFLGDMGMAPSPAHSIDRIDNDGPYGPKNCRWATRVEQNRNKRSVPKLTHDGRTMTLPEWAVVLGVKHRTLRARIYEHGWSVEKALTTPV